MNTLEKSAMAVIGFGFFYFVWQFITWAVGVEFGGGF